MTTAIADQAMTLDQDGCPEGSGLGGMYLSFLLNEEEFAIDILRIREIIGIMDITKVPKTADHLEGVINLRGKVIPVVDLRIKFGLQRREYDGQTCIVVVDVGELMGIIVDTVSEVLEFEDHDIHEAPEMKYIGESDMLLGMARVGEEVKMLLDIDKVLTSDDLVLIQELSG